MEVVDILGAEVEAVGHAALEVGEGEVAGVGLGGEGVAAAHGVEAPDEGGIACQASGVATSSTRWPFQRPPEPRKVARPIRRRCLRR